MPLTGEAKIRRQRERRRERRSEAPIAKLKPLTEALVKPPEQGVTTEVRRKLENQGLKVDGNRILEATKSKSSPSKEQASSKIPLYNWQAPQVGQKVILNGQVVIVPELDADGSPMEAIGRLVSNNVFTSTFQPDPKKVKVKKGRR